MIIKFVPAYSHSLIKSPQILKVLNASNKLKAPNTHAYIVSCQVIPNIIRYYHKLYFSQSLISLFIFHLPISIHKMFVFLINFRICFLPSCTWCRAENKFHTIFYLGSFLTYVICFWGASIIFQTILTEPWETVCYNAGRHRQMILQPALPPPFFPCIAPGYSHNMPTCKEWERDRHTFSPLTESQTFKLKISLWSFIIVLLETTRTVCLFFKYPYKCPWMQVTKYVICTKCTFLI